MRILKYRKMSRPKVANAKRHARNAERVTMPVSRGDTVRVMRGEEVLVQADVRVAFISGGRAKPIPKPLRIAMKAGEAALNLLAVEGTQADLLDLMQTREELYEMIEYKAFEDRDRSHAAGN